MTFALETTNDTDDPLPYGVLAFLEAGTPFAFNALLFVGLTGLLLLSALFSGLETLLSAQDNGNGILANGTKSRLRNNPNRLLATLVLANQLVNTGIVVLGLYAVWHWRQSYDTPVWMLAAFVLAVGFAIVFFGEVLPKLYARRRPGFFTRTATPPLRFLYVLLWPFSWVLLRVTERIERHLHRRGYRISADELTQVLENNASAATSEGEKQLLQGVVQFGTITARQVMQPRLDIAAVPLELDFHQLMDKINKLGYSRIPVYEESLDSLAGILYIKDLMPHLNEADSFDWHQFLRPPYYITENKKIGDLLQDFQARRVHMAIVVDEYGGTSGLVTLEDIVEEIMGDIRDEFDEEEKPYTQIDANTFVFEGKILLKDFCRVLGIDTDAFDEVRGDSESLGGLLLELFARLPQTGEKTAYQSWSFTVLSADTKKIRKVKVSINSELRIQNSEL
jgi:gliding motility-associated protein GldE